MINEDTRKATPRSPGEGERQAQRGYVPQYDIAAAMIYEHIARGNLIEIGVADRTAGQFDDLVLILRDRCICIQVKTSQSPASFSLKTLMLGASGLWRAILESRGSVARLGDGGLLSVYICDDRPSTRDDLGGGTTSALLELHAEHGATWGWTEWSETPFVEFLRELQTQGGLSDDEFLEVWSHLEFVASGLGRTAHPSRRTAVDGARIGQLAALLPRLAADPVKQDRWLLSEINELLGWRGAFTTRHSHVFPVTPLHQANESAEAQLHGALSKLNSGYFSVLGPPGSGKSTLLATGLLGVERARFVKYLAYVPGRGQKLGRGDAETFLHDLIVQFKQQGIGSAIVPGQSIGELREQLQAVLDEASERHRDTSLRTVIVVDGLDHVPREERPEHSLLCELPGVEKIPEGVIFLLGSQTLEFEEIPTSVRVQAEDSDRTLHMPPLSIEAVTRIADAAGIERDIDRSQLFDLSKGHPLSTIYLIEGLAQQTSRETRATWLAAAPSYTGDIEDFYRPVWAAVGRSAAARMVLSYIALSEAPIRLSSLDSLVGASDVDLAWEAAKHLLSGGPISGLTIFHNSFRLFLVQRSLERLGQRDSALERSRYNELADLARAADSNDPQRWLELRYRARARNDAAVTNLAISERFRGQFIEGRDPDDIQEDIRLAAGAAGRQLNALLVFELLLARHEIALRADAMTDELIDAHLSLGDRDAARRLIGQGEISEAAAYRVVDAFLEASDLDAASAVFQELEPLGQLLGSESVSGLDAESSLLDWGYRALAFRTPERVSAAIGQLSKPEDPFFAPDIPALRWRTRIEAARGAISRQPDIDIPELYLRLGLGAQDVAHGLVDGAIAARREGMTVLALARLEGALETRERLADFERRSLAWEAMLACREDLAGLAMEGVAPPGMGPTNYSGDDDVGEDAVAILQHADLRARLGLPAELGDSKAEQPLLDALQTRLESFGAAVGRSRRSGRTDPELESRAISLLTFLAKAEGDQSWDYGRHKLDVALPAILGAVVKALSGADPALLDRFIARIDNAAPEDWRLRRRDVRRAWTLEMFKHDGDTDLAAARLAYIGGQEQTPAAQLGEAGASARALASIGRTVEAGQLLEDMHAEGLGVSLPAKKDPQYAAWRELLPKACEEDPAHRADRISFLMRFLSGLESTEGRDMAGRVMPWVIEEAAAGGPTLSSAVLDRSEAISLTTWFETVTRTVRGVCRREPDLALSAATISGRLAAPFTADRDDVLLTDLIDQAPTAQRQAVFERAVACLESEVDETFRLRLMVTASAVAARHGLIVDLGRSQRWRGELPTPRSGESPEDPFYSAHSLKDMEDILQANLEDAGWRAPRAFARIIEHGSYADAAAFLERRPELGSDRRVQAQMARLAILSGRRAEAERYRDELQRSMTDPDSYYEGWGGGRHIDYHQIDVALRGDVARRAAFERFVDDLESNRIWTTRVIANLSEIIPLLTPTPSWTELWALLAAHMEQFREFAIGDAMAVPRDPDPPNGVAILADLLFRAFDLGADVLISRARLACRELTQDPKHGSAVVLALVNRLVASEDPLALEALQIVWELRQNTVIAEGFAPHLPDLAQHPDVGVRQLAEILGREWDIDLVCLRRDLPAFYSLKLPRAAAATTPAGFSVHSAGVETDDPISWTWPLNDVLTELSTSTCMPEDQLRRRVAALMAQASVSMVEASGQPQARLRRLNVASSWRRPTVEAAFSAFRRLLGELLAGDVISSAHARRLSRRAGVDGLSVLDLIIERRPPELPRPTFGARQGEDLYREEHFEAWLAAIGDDITAPRMSEWAVIGGWSRHQIETSSRKFVSEQFYGHGEPAEDLDSQIRGLPMVGVGDLIQPFYDKPIAGVVRARGPRFWDGPDSPHLLPCPVSVASLGWGFASDDVGLVSNARGEIVIRTLSWRDSGACDVYGRTTTREGRLVLAKRSDSDALLAFRGPGLKRTAWRRVEAEGKPTVTRTASADFGG